MDNRKIHPWNIKGVFGSNKSGECYCGTTVYGDWICCPRCGSELDWNEELSKNYVCISDYFLKRCDWKLPENLSYCKSRNYGEIIYETKKAYLLLVEIQYLNLDTKKEEYDFKEIWVPKSQTRETIDAIERKNEIDSYHPIRQSNNFDYYLTKDEQIEKLKEEIRTLEEVERRRQYSIDVDEGDNCAPGAFGWMY